MKSEMAYLPLLLAAALRDEVPPSSAVDWDRLFALTEAQQLRGMVYFALRRRADCPKEVLARFEHAALFTAQRNVYQQQEAEGVLAMLHQHGIPALLLKGAVLKPLYPDDAMRASCDVDILFDSSARDRAAELMKARGYTQTECTLKDWTFQKPPFLSVELHFRLFEHAEQDARFFGGDPWELCKTEDGYALPPAYMYVYLLAHFAVHLTIGGGSGVRPLIDCYLYRKKCSPDTETVNLLLARLSLTEFSETVERLSEAWFEDGPRDARCDALAAELLGGHVYGTAAGVSEEQAAAYQGNVARYLRDRLFPPRTVMQAWYPVLETRPYLLPIMWVRRAWNRIFVRKNAGVALARAGRIHRKEGSDRAALLGLDRFVAEHRVDFRADEKQV